MENTSLKKELLKAFSYCVFMLMAIPAVTYFFTVYVMSTQRIWRRHFDQFQLVHSSSFWLLVCSVAVLALIMGLAFLAFSNRKIQYASFVVGWRLLILLCVVELLMQGAFLTWLSYWVTVVFFNSYVPKFIGVVGIMVGMGVLSAIYNMFKRVPLESKIDGVMLSRVDAPVLWKHVESFAAKMKTSPPDHIFTGIDASFFVTESPLTVNDQTIQGRTLFISIPLLRILSREEADSVLAHELNHLRGGDTRNSAALTPKLQKYGFYLEKMYEGLVTRVVYYPLNFYRLLFEIALQRESRSREFLADKAAAEMVSGKAFAEALIKIVAYSSYRNQVESNLFEHTERLEGELGIGAKVSQGLIDYAHSQQFLEGMKQSSIAHPFDSHPLLNERLSNVGYNVGEEQFAFIVTQKPDQTWVDDIPSADSIEQQQWQVYEQNFSEDHERMLAFRYEPVGVEQEAIVLKYFPDQTFSLKKNKSVTVSYRGILTPEGVLHSWSQISYMQYADGTFSDTLTLTIVPEEATIKGNSKAKGKNVAIKLAGIKANRQAFKDALGTFSHRHAVMLEMQAAAKMEEGKEDHFSQSA